MEGKASFTLHGEPTPGNTRQTVAGKAGRGHASKESEDGEDQETGRCVDRDITEGTAKTHVKAILTKLDAISRTEAVAVAHKRGMIRL